MAILRAATLAALTFCCTALPAAAQDVTLTSRDGGVEITGNLLGFDGEFYRVDTIYGEMTVDGSRVRCEGAGCPDLEAFVAEVTLSGAPTIGQVLMPALIEAFALREGLELTRDERSDIAVTYTLSNPDSGAPRGRFHLRLTNTDEGFADLLAGEADVVMALRELRGKEATRGREAGLGDLRDARRSRVLALDALVPLVSAGNPLTTITMPQLVRVLSGEIDNWAALGGADAPIALHLPDPGTGLGQATDRQLLSGDGESLASTAQRHLTGAALSQAVAEDPLALGIGSRSGKGLAAELAVTGPCGFAMTATRHAVKTEDYPLTMPMLLYLPAHRLPRLVREFLAYTREPAAQLVIRRAGFVDQLPEEIAINAQGDRFANAVLRAGEGVTLADLQHMVEVLRPLRRLTTTFRFEPGTTRLDKLSRENIDSLARALESGFHDGEDLLFVGFSDGEGLPETNLTVARRRAETVRDAVRAAAGTALPDRPKMETETFGEAMPMACDDSDRGRRSNRRVEVWTR